MMTPDIQQRLIELGSHLRKIDSGSPEGSMMYEAADEIARLRLAVSDAYRLIDNDLVIPWIIAHRLDDVLGTSCQPGPAGARGQVGWMGGEFDR